VVASAVALSMATGCLHVDPVTCPDGSVCPHGTHCDGANHRCVSPDQSAACEGMSDGDPCMVGTKTGTCIAGACVSAICGDGVREPNEECEGDDVGGNSCETLGYYGGPLSCTGLCTFNFSGCAAVGRCGDGIVNGPEICDGADPVGLTCLDYGFDVGHLGCSTSCAPDFSGCGRIGWARMVAPSVAILRGTWASSPHDVYAVGYQADSTGVVLHYDGHAWSPISIGIDGEPISVTGTGASDVYVFVLRSGTGWVTHWDGASWTSTVVVSGDYVLASATTPGGDTYAVGAAGSIVHHAAGSSTWDPMASGTSFYLRAVWARNATDVWAVGDSATALHFDGTSWSAVSLPGGGYFDAVSGLGDRDVYIASSTQVFHGDGSSWEVLPQASTFAAMAATPSSLFVGGTQTWDLSKDGHNLVATAGTLGPGLYSQFGGDRIGHLWAIGASTISEYRGAAWLNLPGPQAMWGSDVSHVFGANCTEYTGGFGWNPPASTCNMYAVWGTGPTNVYAVGGAGQVEHYDGSSWTRQQITASDLQAVWGSGPNDVYAVGKAGVVLHFDGTSWQAAPIPAGTTADLYGVWGSDADHVFIVGSQGVVLRYDGVQWASTPMMGGVTWRAIWGTGSGDVWLVGDGGAILHYDGSVWSPVSSGTTASLDAIWGSARNDVFAAGSAGTIVHYDGVHWDPIAPFGVGLITSIWGDGRYVFFGSGAEVLDRSSYPPGGCVAHETSCNDAVDDDCDMLVDCADPDCKGDPACK
jgi:hypothetical protein